ncbi:hypothetical protein J6590_094936 [Homalodisca vitripennis]|nr:hypothetical protein J6590_094936 [Homalodisca vitripennis]
MSDKCSKCKLDFVISTEGVKCTDCGELYHLKCLTVELGKKATRKNWKCEVCASETSSTSSRAGEGVIAAFRAEVSDFRKESSEKWDLKNRIACGDIVALMGENRSLKGEVNVLRAELADLQQHKRKTNILISDVINVEFLRSDISVAHRLQGRSSDTRLPSIVVSLVSRSTKAMWISAARERKGLLASDIHSSFPPDSKWRGPTTGGCWLSRPHHGTNLPYPASRSTGPDEAQDHGANDTGGGGLGHHTYRHSSRCSHLDL